jgi:hypothetical protein
MSSEGTRSYGAGLARAAAAAGLTVIECEQPTRKIRPRQGQARPDRLRALLRDGDDPDRELGRARLSGTMPASLARRHQPRDASRQQAVRHSEIRRLALDCS